jgi:serine/threonine-protein kinase
MLAPGTRLGSYEIVSALGAGGMGEVYCARDTRLKREVALKILPDTFASDPERLARFQREAEVLASLNHPNIAAIHGLEDRALVLELVEGETLADRIARGPVPLDEALPIARQIAEALEAAHDRGIIHRDLKPANIKLRPDGTVKVLDFGLAKLADVGRVLSDPSRGAGSEDLAQLSLSPTITSPALITGAGVLLGTAAYMSPEQAKGKPVDKRADIWAFGCVLFEMLAGVRAFGGDEIAETMAAVIRGEPDWQQLPRESTPSIRRLLRRCLVKDPKQRLSEAATARMEIDDAQREQPLAETSGRRRSPIRSMAPYVATAVVAAAVALPLGWLNVGSPGDTRTPMRFTLELPQGAQLAPNARQRLAISPDGSRVAYVANEGGVGRLYVRTLDQLESIPLRGLERVGSIFFSPDGEWIGYNDTNTGAFRKVPVAGGPSATICDVPSATGGFRGATWGAGGRIVFATGAAAGLMQVPESGGTPTPLTKPSTEGEIHRDPFFMPDGNQVLFVLQRPKEPDRIAAVSLDNPEPRILFEGTSPQFAASGHLVFRREQALWSVPFDAATSTVTGVAEPVLEGVGGMNANQRAAYAIAANGTMVYSPAGALASRLLVWVDRMGREEPIPAPPHTYSAVRVSPDGERVALNARDEENDIWVWHLRGQTLTRVTFDPAADENPVWAPDGRRIAFASNRENGLLNLYWRNADGTGEDERLTNTTQGQRPTSFSPDGRWLLYNENEVATMVDVRRMEPAAPRPSETVVQTPFIDLNAEVSPDGRWVAYESRESGVYQIFVRPFPDAGAGRWQVTTQGGTEPAWSRDGRELFFVGVDGRLSVVPVSTANGFAAGPPRTLLQQPYLFGLTQGRIYDVAPDGKRFLMIKSGDTLNAGPQIVVVLNWFEELRRLERAN